MDGWIKIHRKMLDNPVVMKDPDYLAVWMHLLLNATYDSYTTMFNGEKIELKPGQLVTGRKKISTATGVSESKTKRVLEAFKNDHQIDQQATPHGSLITIVSWDKYQISDQQNDRLMDNKWTTTDQQLTTITRKKESKKEINDSYSFSYGEDEPEFKSILNEWRRERGLPIRG